jgi:hypothetical protein
LRLLGGHFFLFAFHAHLLELALFGFDGSGDFLLDCWTWAAASSSSGES